MALMYSSTNEIIERLITQIDNIIKEEGKTADRFRPGDQRRR